jgi:hypothetical protein
MAHVMYHAFTNMTLNGLGWFDLCASNTAVVITGTRTHNFLNSKQVSRSLILHRLHNINGRVFALASELSSFKEKLDKILETLRI